MLGNRRVFRLDGFEQTVSSLRERRVGPLPVLLSLEEAFGQPHGSKQIARAKVVTRVLRWWKGVSSICPTPGA